MRYKGKKEKCWQLLRKRVFEKYGTDCYTCPAKALTSYNLQAGHYLPVAIVGSNNRLSWDIGQIRPQCGRCNGAGQGMQVEFRRRLVQDLGEEAVADFEKRRWRVDPIKNWDTFFEEL